MADLRDFTGKNRRFTGTDSIKIPTGTTGERVVGSGKIRFNSTNNLMEYYTGTEWKSIDSPPIVNTIAIAGGAAAASGALDNSLSGNVSIVIAGSLFDTTGSTVLLEATSGSNITPSTISRDNANQITIGVPYSSFVNANEPYSVKVTNPSGLSASLADAIYADTIPTFTNAADTTFSIFDTLRSSITITPGQLVGATDAESDTLTYAITTGALPSGLTMASNTGQITGSVSAVGSDTTSTFICTVTQTGGGASNARQFKITVKGPTVTTFNASGTFTVPTGLSAVTALVVAGGGGSNYHHGGGGGGGGLIYRPAFPITPGTPIAVTVGDGAPETTGSPNAPKGQDSVFSTLTAKGGGGGQTEGQSPNGPGGSGSGAGYNPSHNGTPGQAIQPTQPGDSGTYGFGNPGGNGFYTSPPTGAQGGGGGGAGGGGGNSGPNNSGQGGAGKQYDISGSNAYYAGGGCGGGHTNAGSATGGQGGGGSRPGSGPGQRGQPGTANTGGGGGGSNDRPANNPGGGSGIVILKY